jgi:hypothetical protein
LLLQFEFELENALEISGVEIAKKSLAF